MAQRHVGKATISLLSDFVDIVVYDVASNSHYPYDELSECTFSIICVGTPEGNDGAPDLSQVWSAVQRTPTARLILRSTVPPGTSDDLAARTGKAIVHWPEYLVRRFSLEHHGRTPGPRHDYWL